MNPIETRIADQQIQNQMNKNLRERGKWTIGVNSEKFKRWIQEVECRNLNENKMHGS
jgi:hypothetical protein